jgi:hypothetical protein
MIQITKKLAEDLLDDITELLNENIPMRNYPRYETRCKDYERKIEELKKAINKI